jgi:hypothetical protein
MLVAITEKAIEIPLPTVNEQPTCSGLPDH